MLLLLFWEVLHSKKTRRKPRMWDDTKDDDLHPFRCVLIGIWDMVKQLAGWRADLKMADIEK